MTPSPPSTLLTLTTLTTRGRATTLAGCEAVIRDNEGENEKVGDDTNGISVRGIMQSGQGWEGSGSLFGIDRNYIYSLLKDKLNSQIDTFD